VIDVAFSSRRLLLAGVSAALVLGWGLRRFDEALALSTGRATHQFSLCLMAIFVFFAWQLWLSWRERPIALTLDDQRRVHALTVCVNVPVYNEDPVLLDKVIDSLCRQTRLPNRIQVVDDGSSADYAQLRQSWQTKAPEGTAFSWIRTVNRGKRHAQMETFTFAEEDVLVTMDSDTVLHREAIAEGIKPFAREDVASVAGLVLALNKHENFITRVEDLVVTTWQLTMRSAHSMLGSVTVNSGPFALYRAPVIKQAREGYLNETIMGKPVQFSDDSLLTLYAARDGRTVQQPSAIAFSAWPESLSHHLRQQIRWTRGSFIRSLWRFKYLPVRGAAFWLAVIGWSVFASTTAMFVVVFVVAPGGVARLIPTVVVALLLSYATTIRTLSIRRSDETLGQQLGVYALSPFVVIWAWLIYRPLRFWGMVTFLKTGWGTRDQIEGNALAVRVGSTAAVG
jgi:hyaluronan synthase